MFPVGNGNREEKGRVTMNWYRLFGLALMDFFIGSPYVVELEKDLSVKCQLLDVMVFVSIL